MSCEQQTSGGPSDSLAINPGKRPFDNSATAWLIGQGIHYLNTADKEGQAAYERVVELLRRCSKDLLETIANLLRHEGTSDVLLRWNLLYVLGDTGDAQAADLLARAALDRLPDSDEDQGCQGIRDAEMLVRTMAVQALRRVATRHPEVSETLLKIISARPAKPVLIEAVKVAVELGLKEKIEELLPQDDHWILDIRRIRIEEIYAEPEREDTHERVFSAPRLELQYAAPSVTCSGRREK